MEIVNSINFHYFYSFLKSSVHPISIVGFGECTFLSPPGCPYQRTYGQSIIVGYPLGLLMCRSRFIGCSLRIMVAGTLSLNYKNGPD